MWSNLSDIRRLPRIKIFPFQYKITYDKKIPYEHEFHSWINAKLSFTFQFTLLVWEKNSKNRNKVRLTSKGGKESNKYLLEIK